MFAFVPTVLVAIVMGQPCPVTQPGPGTSCYEPATNTVYIAPRDVHSRSALWHERGHAYDHLALTDSERDWLLTHFDTPATAWKNGGEEEFADEYAECQIRARLRNRLVCGWLQRRTAIWRLQRRLPSGL